ncbi:MAG: extracellular solute-binding protein [bacterium]
MAPDTDTAVSSQRQMLALIRERFLIDEAREKLPSERELERTLGVSRTLIRPCLRSLEESGEIYRQPGGRIRYIRRAAGGSEAPPPWFHDPFDFASPLIRGRTAQLTIASMDLCGGTSARVRECYQRWAQRFNAHHEQIEVRLADWPADGSAWADFPPEVDVAIHTSMVARNLHAEGQICALDKIIPPDEIDHWRTRASRLPGNFADDRLVGLPFGSITPAMAINRKLWKACSSTPLEQIREWDWSQCLDVAEAMARKLGGPPIHLCSLTPIICSAGCWLLDRDIDTDLARAASVLHRLMPLGHVSAATAGRADVASGRLGMSPISTTTQSQLEERFGDTVAVVPFPCEPKGWLPRYDLSLLLRPSYQWAKEAWLLMRFLAEHEQQRELGALNHYVPAARPERDDIATALDWRLRSFARSRPIDRPISQMRVVESDILVSHMLSWMRAGEVCANDLDRLLDQLQALATP